MNYFWVIFNILLIIALIYWMFRSYKSKKYNKTLFVISVIISVILIIPLSNGILSHADGIIHPTPFLKVDTKHVKLTGTNQKGTLTGKTLSNAMVTLKDTYGVDKDINVKSDDEGNFTAKNLDNSTDYKIISSKNGKKSNSVKVSVSDIPDSAYTKFHIKNSNDMGSLTLNNSDDNKVSISGTASPHSTIKITDPDMDYSVVKTLRVKSDGKWTIILDGPGTGENDKKEKEYDFSAKAKNRAAKDDDSVYIENTNHKNTSKKKVNKYDKYTKQLNSYVNRGNATDVSYDQTGNTVTWTGFEAWEDYSYNDLEPLITLLQAVTLRRADANNVETPNIKIILPNGQQIAHRDVGNEMKFDN